MATSSMLDIMDRAPVNVSFVNTLVLVFLFCFLQEFFYVFEKHVIYSK